MNLSTKPMLFEASTLYLAAWGLHLELPLFRYIPCVLFLSMLSEAQTLESSQRFTSRLQPFPSCLTS